MSESSLTLSSTFAQFGEDLLAASCFPEGFKGRLLEIGAWQPEVFSNSRAFILDGWEATLVEPSPEPFRQLLVAYGKNRLVTLVSAAVVMPWEVETGLRLNMSDDALSAPDGLSHQRWVGVADFYGPAIVGAMSVRQMPCLYGQRHNDVECPYDLISIDTEGSSYRLFKYMIATMNLTPRCYIVEYDEFLEAVMELAHNHGYRQVATPNGTNVVLKRDV